MSQAHLETDSSQTQAADQGAVNDKIEIEPRAEGAAHCPLCRHPIPFDAKRRKGWEADFLSL